MSVKRKETYSMPWSFTSLKKGAKLVLLFAAFAALAGALAALAGVLATFSFAVDFAICVFSSGRFVCYVFVSKYEVKRDASDCFLAPLARAHTDHVFDRQHENFAVA